MPLVSELELQELDYTDPSLRGDRFHHTMRALSARGWLASGPFGYVALDRDAGEFFLRSRHAVFPGMTIAEIFGVSEGPLYEQMRHNILHVNGADHTRLRNLVNPALSARAVERYRPAMRRFLEQLLERACVDGERGEDGLFRCEFVGAFARPYPSQTIALVMGAPIADAPRLHHWSGWIQRQFDAASMATERDAIEQAVREFYVYAEALVARARADPGDDLISKLVAATLDQDHAPDSNSDPAAARASLTDLECINLVFNVLVGGVDTTQSQLAHAVRLLAEHPQQWELLRSRPELAAAAVEEALRFEPITPFTARITTAEVTFRDVTFPAGTVVMVCALTGNRDLESHQGPPHEFDIAAQRASARPLTFGAGVHYCLGANLARAELTEALAFLAHRFALLELDGPVEYDTITGIYGLTQLPIRFSL